jgi:Ca-activated chloride channel homolog
MKKLFVVLGLISLLSVLALAQSGKRPRIVVTPSPTPEVEEVYSESKTPETNTNQTPKRPPVLIGATKSTTPNNAPVLNGGEPSPTPPTEETVIEDDDDVIKIETSLVTLPVSVIDREGRFIAGLRKENFQIFEDGVQQKVEYFASVEQPFTVALLLDVSGSTESRVGEIRNSANTFISQLRANDKVMIIAFSDRVRVMCEPTNNRAVLQDAISRSSVGGGTAIYDAVGVAFNKLRQTEGRKAVVLFTDGVDTNSKRASTESSVREAEEMDALIYPIRYNTYEDMQNRSGGGNSTNSGGGVVGAILGSILGGGKIGGTSGTSKKDYAKGLLYLQDMARVSGGRFFSADNATNLDASFRGIAEELRRQYSIGYMPENVGQPGQRKQIKIRVNRENAIVKTRTSYVVGENENKNVVK